MAEKVPLRVVASRGRPSSLTPEMAERICLAIANGQSLRKICEASDLPHRNTVLRWVEESEDFRGRYARARAMAADHFFDLIVEEAQAVTPENAAAARVKIDALKWASSKLRPQAYSDRLQVAGDPEQPLVVQRELTPLDSARQVAFALALATANQSQPIEAKVVGENQTDCTKL